MLRSGWGVFKVDIPERQTGDGLNDRIEHDTDAEAMIGRHER